ncbi:NADH-quinone oxidoreductase subunit N [Thermodesulfobacterium sp. TA1]|uniref:NADH-quinone oxidoreductase subunit N n=1 Tax=Thermodesulfobacterium sp. TA1 TaxID=2234087 RepID=UPI001232CB8B|nr:NADH-quinone oxidoreductase subunit N [Thermodesulfobacterium sp. TA1]QER41350.1 NADH-quinone oxidoreductase subunit N [Thermodesulfobacterium sp. TA1]
MTIELNFGVILAELLFLIVVCFIFLFDRIFKNKGYAFWLSLLSFLGAAFLLLIAPFGNFTLSYQSDFFSTVFKFLILSGAFLILILSRNYLIHHPSLNYGEYYGFLLLSLVGAFLMLSSMDLVTMYLAMELMSFPVYLLIALNFAQEKKSLEGAFKYFLAGAIGSVFLLLGMGLVYSFTGSLFFMQIAQSLFSKAANSYMLLGFLFILVGFSIKMSFVPFHMWAPDAYESAPLPITSFIASVVKFVVIACLIKLLLVAFIPLKTQIGQMLIPVILLTILIGNVLAIKQDHLIRMLAFSSIAHAGYAGLGLISGDLIGYSFTLFYLLVYLVMTIGMFSVAVFLANYKKDLLYIPKMAGLSQVSPGISFLTLIFMFSLAGIPPTAGFMGKFYLFLGLIKSGYVWVALLAILFSVIGAYPYLRVLKFIYMEKTEESFSYRWEAGVWFPVSLTAFLILLIGVYPKPWADMVYQTLYFYLTFLFYPY